MMNLSNEVNRKCFHCGSYNTEPRLYAFKNGTQNVVMQCNHCGGRYGNWISKNKIENLEDLKPFNEAAEKKFRDKQAYNRERMNVDVSADWWNRYNDHLNSRAWKIKRDAVLERDSYWCQACQSRKAKDVHHLSYKRMGNEPLFDLVSVCRECHQKLHPDKDLGL